MSWLPEKHFPRAVTNLPPLWPIFWPNVFLNHVTEEYLHTTQIFLLKTASSTSIPGFKQRKQSPTKNFGAGMWLRQLVSTTIFHLPEVTTKWRWAALPRQRAVRALTKARPHPNPPGWPSAGGGGPGAEQPLPHRWSLWTAKLEPAACSLCSYVLPEAPGSLG